MLLPLLILKLLRFITYLEFWSFFIGSESIRGSNIKPFLSNTHTHRTLHSGYPSCVRSLLHLKYSRSTRSPSLITLDLVAFSISLVLKSRVVLSIIYGSCFIELSIACWSSSISHTYFATTSLMLCLSAFFYKILKPIRAYCFTGLILLRLLAPCGRISQVLTWLWTQLFPLLFYLILPLSENKFGLIFST